MEMVDLPKPITFEWDRGNKDKSFAKHGITAQECEEAFEVEGQYIQSDELHSGKEPRYIMVSVTKQGRKLFIAFTIRNKAVRVISARAMHAKEQKFYEEKTRLA